jgi:hypothetical protein
MKTLRLTRRHVVGMCSGMAALVPADVSDQNKKRYHQWATPTGVLFTDPRVKPLSTTGAIQPACYFTFYLTGTTTLTSVYADAGFRTPLTNPVVADSAGRFVPIYLNPATIYRVQLHDANNNILDDTDPYIVPSSTGFVPTQSSIGALLYPITAAETSASVTPIFSQYPEGDIRRYGGTTAAADNSDAINNALVVCQEGGAAAYIPPGRWKITNTLTPSGNASMYGAGGSSVIYANGCNGITFGIGAFYQPNNTTGGMDRFMRDFQLIGSNPTNSTNCGIVINFTADSGNRVAGVRFQSLFISNFHAGMYLRGAWNCRFDDVFGWNNFYGMYFIGQNARNVVKGGGWVLFSTGMSGTGQSYGISFQSADGESTQSTQLIAAYVFGYSIGINASLALELQIDDCDISSCQAVGVSVTSIIGGFWLTSSWVECQSSSAVTGVLVNPTGANNYQDIHIVGNHITNDKPFSGSIGISINFNHPNVIVKDNRIEYFDIGISNSASNFVCKNNSISITTPVYSGASVVVRCNSSATDCEIGPNYIQPGTAQAALMTNASANIGVPSSRLFPVGQPAQFDATVNGFTVGVTYFVLTSAANVITVGAVAGGSAIAATGRAAVNVFQAPLAVTFTASTPTGLQFFGRGAFIMALSDPGVITIVNWVANGRTVTASYAGVSGASTVTTMTGSNVPAAINPINPQFTLASIINSGTANLSYTTIGAAGTWTFTATPAGGAFTASGTKGLNSFSFSYPYL